MSRLKDKVIVILGASDTRSMGAATARRFAEEGAKLVLAARRLDKVQEIANAIGAKAVACDITDEAQIEALADTAISEYGRLDGAINYSGVNTQAPILEIDRADLDLSCNVHFIGSVLFLKHMARRMENGGSLLTTSSMTALLAPEGLTAYAGAKRGVDQVVRIAANELGPKGIRVNSIAPGFMRSGMTDEFFSIPTLEPAFQREIPLGRLGGVNDIANTALWLISEESAATTGQIIDCTSGQTLRRIPTGEEMMS